jgi:23S rRNA pseudouridine1911/1915/1917 synthase
MISGGTINAPIGRHPTKRTLMAIAENGKSAITHYRIIERFRAHTHLKVQLETGRTHQIRVHMAHIQHPIVGDSTYSGRIKLPKGASAKLIETLRQFKHPALHARRLTLIHPATKESMTFNADTPIDFQNLASMLHIDTQEH